MGHATFLDLIRSIKKIRYKDIVETVSLYQWEIAGATILIFCTMTFGDLLSFTFLNLLLAYFWSWTIASPQLVKKCESKSYRFSILKGVIRLERKLRTSLLLPFWPSQLDRTFYRPLGRILSVLLIASLSSLALNQFLIHWFLLGSLLFEFFNTLKYFSR